MLPSGLRVCIPALVFASLAIAVPPVFAQRYDMSIGDQPGLIPDTSDSGETKRHRGIIQRSNHILRAALVESGWAVIRKDPALLLKYRNYCKHMEKNKAIIRVCKHLLSRVSYVLKNHQEYIIGIVA